MPDLIRLTEEDLLDLLVEESAEVIKAAIKIKRFGWNREYAGYGHNGRELAKEMGHVHALIHEILDRHPEVKNDERQSRLGKILKATLVKNGVLPDPQEVVE